MSVFVKKTLFGIITFTFTMYAVANAYEVLASKDLPYINALDTTKLETVIDNVQVEYSQKLDNRFINQNAKLDTLERLGFKDFNTMLFLEPERKIEGKRYLRPTYASYSALNTDDYNNAVDYLIYTKKSWKTLPYTDEIEPGHIVTLFTQNGLRVPLIVEDKTIKNFNQPLVLTKSEKRQIVLLVEDEARGVYYGYSLVSNR